VMTSPVRHAPSSCPKGTDIENVWFHVVAQSPSVWCIWWTNPYWMDTCTHLRMKTRLLALVQDSWHSAVRSHSYQITSISSQSFPVHPPHCSVCKMMQLYQATGMQEQFIFCLSDRFWHKHLGKFTISGATASKAYFVPKLSFNVL
jgi:hypothetical protein